MSAALDRTFELLARTGGPASTDALVAALDVPDDRIRLKAVQVLVRRSDFLSGRELVLHWPSFAPEIRTVLERNVTTLSGTLRQCLQSGDTPCRQHALEMVAALEDYGQIGALVQLLESSAGQERDWVEHALRGLVDRLSEHLRFDRESAAVGNTRRYLREAPRIRQVFLETLEKSANRFEAHRSAVVVEALLALADPGDSQLKRLFRDPRSPLAEAAGEQLLKSTHPGVLTLLFESQGQTHPFLPATQALSRREDPEFVCHILRQWPKSLTPIQQRNFREVQSFAFLERRPLNLEVLPPGLHKRLVVFLTAIGLAQDHKLEVLEWLVRHGSPEGRLAATGVLAEIPDEKVHEVVLEGLESDVSEVQAWATTQLRPREIPGAIELLLERLDSPLLDVREAARTELGDFNLNRVLDLYEGLDAVRARAVGKLVRKIDPETIEKLRAELAHPVHRRRLRAIQCAERVGWLEDVQPELVARLDDEESIVRRAAVEALQSFPKLATRELPRMMQDPSPRVRDSVDHVLSSIGVLEESI